MDSYSRRRVADNTQVCRRGLGGHAGQRGNFFGEPGKSGIFCRLQNSRLALEETEFTSEAVVGSSVRTFSADLTTLKEQAERMSRALQELERQINILEERQ